MDNPGTKKVFRSKKRPITNWTTRLCLTPESASPTTGRVAHKLPARYASLPPTAARLVPEHNPKLAPGAKGLVGPLGSSETRRQRRQETRGPQLPHQRPRGGEAALLVPAVGKPRRKLAHLHTGERKFAEAWDPSISGRKCALDVLLFRLSRTAETKTTRQRWWGEAPWSLDRNLSSALQWLVKDELHCGARRF